MVGAFQEEKVEFVDELFAGHALHPAGIVGKACFGVRRHQVPTGHNAEILEDRFQHVIFGEQRIQDQSGPDPFIQFAEQRPAKGGLAGADIADDGRKTFLPLDPVDHAIQRRAEILLTKRNSGSGVRLKGFSFRP